MPTTARSSRSRARTASRQEPADARLALGVFVILASLASLVVRAPIGVVALLVAVGLALGHELPPEDLRGKTTGPAAAQNLTNTENQSDLRARQAVVWLTFLRSLAWPQPGPGVATAPDGSTRIVWWPINRPVALAAIAAGVTTGLIPWFRWPVASGIAVYWLVMAVATTGRTMAATPPATTSRLVDLDKAASFLVGHLLRLEDTKVGRLPGFAQAISLSARLVEKIAEQAGGRPVDPRASGRVRPGLVVGAIVAGVTAAGGILIRPYIHPRRIPYPHVSLGKQKFPSHWPAWLPHKVGISYHPVDAVVAGLVLGATVGIATWARLQTTGAVAAWEEEQEKRQAWTARWAATKLAPPAYMSEDAQPPDNPQFSRVLFAIPSGADLDAYLDAGPKLASALGTGLVLVSPVPETDEDGIPIPGSRHPGALLVSYATAPLSAGAHLDKTLPGEVRSFAMGCVIDRAFVQLKLGHPTITNIRELTTKDSFGSLCEMNIALPQGVTIDDVVRRTPAIAEKVGAPFVRLGQRIIRKGTGAVRSSTLSLVVGSPPSTVTLATPAAKRLLADLEWETAFRACRLSCPNGTWLPLTTEPGAYGLEVTTFAPVPGLSADDAVEAQGALQGAIRRPYLVVTKTEDPAGGIKVVVGDADPLDGIFLFEEYADQIIVGPDPDREGLVATIGVGPDGNLVTYRWDEAEPHLVIAGGTGMGKSSLLHVLLLQLASNYAEDQFEIWMADPKNELQRYRGISHLTRFVDFRSPGEHPANQIVPLLLEAKAEMNRRIELFDSLPGRPQKLAEVHAGMRDGTYSLDETLPYIIILIEECADYFEQPTRLPDKEENEELQTNWRRVTSTVELLARKARSSGIYLIVATQRPTKVTVPTNLKSQSRRIGFGVSDVMSSLVIIDQAGLEEIKTPGRGLYPTRAGFMPFRSFYVSPGYLNRMLDSLPRAPEGRSLAPRPGIANALPPSPDGIW